MKDKAFLDTNIFVYLYSADEEEKKRVCISEIKKYKCITSTQALNELSNVFSKKWGLKSKDISNAINEILGFCHVVLIDVETINKALDIHDNYGFSYYDSLMLSSALQNGCKYVLSEDMKDKQMINNALQIVNIFKRN